MNDNSDQRFTYPGYCPPGSVTVSPAALAMARRFREEIAADGVAGDWIVCFDWATSRRWRSKGSVEWIDLGAGFDLAASERSATPADAIQVLDGLELVINIPPDVLSASKEQRIEVDARTQTHLALR